MELDPTNEIRIRRSLLVGSDDPQCRISERLFGLAAVGFRTIFDGMTSLNDEEAPDSLVQICANDSRESRFLELEADISLEAVYRQGSQSKLVVGEPVPVRGGGPCVLNELREAGEFITFKRRERQVGPEENITVHQMQDVASFPRGDHGGGMGFVLYDVLSAVGDIGASRPRTNKQYTLAVWTMQCHAGRGPWRGMTEWMRTVSGATSAAGTSSAPTTKLCPRRGSANGHQHTSQCRAYATISFDASSMAWRSTSGMAHRAHTSRLSMTAQAA